MSDSRIIAKWIHFFAIQLKEIQVIKAYRESKVKICKLLKFITFHPPESKLKFMSVGSHLNLVFFCISNLFLLGTQPPFTVS